MKPQRETSVKTQRSAVAMLVCAAVLMAGCPLGAVPEVAPGDPPADAPGTPGMPGPSGSPGTSGAPDRPDVPGTPGSPDKPGTPSTPDTPRAPDTPSTPEKPRPSVPDELVGKWQSILTYVPANYEYQGSLPVRDLIGSYGVFYSFSADGQYQIDLRALANYYDFMCVLNGHRQEWGTVEMVGAACTFRPTRAFESNLDSCGGSAYIDPAPTRVQTVTLAAEFDATGWPLVRLVFPDGEELLLEKCRECE